MELEQHHVFHQYEEETKVCPECADDFVGNGGPAQGDGVHVLLGVLDALADGLADFAGLAHAVAHLALAVAQPRSLSMYAVKVESTPPDIPTTTVSPACGIC